MRKCVTNNLTEGSAMFGIPIKQYKNVYTDRDPICVRVVDTVC